MDSKVTIAVLNQKFAGKKIIVLPGHEWSGEHCEFVCMANKDESIPEDTDRPSPNTVMKVKTSFGTYLYLTTKYVFIIEKQLPNQNSKFN